MAPLQALKDQDLISLRNTSIKLRDKMTQYEREIPLLKLLEREIAILNDEIAARKLTPERVKELSAQS